ncbi:hypothetical protein M431DRAFT_537236 [Trichoderma harzianum CBS 226.95]|uniref:Uncharacterized protein n=1 Tax=Trichoderma harzianum CBS 226.95 TaxID=983964 RepID=A0A2T4ATK1_TRIHA|nr:hypothetical protein M431DRAFT_537236 [Trichoderma harzianum CBS 226.95]PTB60395.1 hypothetical protein M431DRAFT_537236 [Trichoderma harzianum CBS 226.95]
MQQDGVLQLSSSTGPVPNTGYWDYKEVICGYANSTTVVCPERYLESSFFFFVFASSKFSDCADATRARVKFDACTSTVRNDNAKLRRTETTYSAAAGSHLVPEFGTRASGQSANPAPFNKGGFDASHHHHTISVIQENTSKGYQQRATRLSVRGSPTRAGCSSAQGGNSEGERPLLFFISHRATNAVTTNS